MNEASLIRDVIWSADMNFKTSLPLPTAEIDASEDVTVVQAHTGLHKEISMTSNMLPVKDQGEQNSVLDSKLVEI